MSKEEIIKIISQCSEEIKKFGVDSLFLFGSAARNEAKEKSDLDFIVEFSGDPTFDRFMDLKYFLENRFGRPVDLVTKRALRPCMRDRVFKEAIHVA